MGEFSIERSLEIKAPIGHIWDQLLEVMTWPEWKPFIKGVSFEGSKIEMGSMFTMNIAVKGPAVPVKVTVCDYEKPKRIAWTGGIPGVVISVHGFTFEEKGDKTLVKSYEHFTGLLVRLMLKLVTEKDLESLHDRWLEAIKLRMEKTDQD